MTKRKGLLIALVSSLVINALLIGSWVGHRLHGDPLMHSMSRHILKRPPETLSEQAREVLKAERGAICVKNAVAWRRCCLSSRWIRWRWPPPWLRCVRPMLP